MDSSFANLTRWLLLASVALAAAYPAQAQRARGRPGQPILFSSADDDNVSSNRPPLAPKPPGSLGFANAIQSPDANLGAASQTGPLPEPPPPAISPAQAQQMQRLLDERKNWALLTPEQILASPRILGMTRWASRRTRRSWRNFMNGRTGCGPARTMPIMAGRIRRRAGVFRATRGRRWIRVFGPPRRQAE